MKNNEDKNRLQDIRNNANVQIKVNNIWRKLIIFTDDCPYGKYGYKSHWKKPFSPYIFIHNGEDVEKISKYLQS